MNNSEKDLDSKKIIKQFRIAAAIAFAVLAIGVVFYHHVEKLSWLDAAYFCTITLTTIGYGDITPKTDAGKIFTIGYVLAGIGIIGAFINIAITRAVASRKHRDSS